MLKREGQSREQLNALPPDAVLSDFIERGITVIGQHLFKGTFGYDNVHELGECTVDRQGDTIVFEDIRNRKNVWKIKESDFSISQMDATTLRFTGTKDEYVVFLRSGKLPNV